MKLSFKKRFGLMLAGVGAFMAALSLITNTLDIVSVVSSTILIILGIIFWFIG